jgi:hypothetical protein
MMPPTISIESYKSFIQTNCLPKIKRGQEKQFLFGLSSLSIRPFVSLGSNARSTALSRSAAESKMYRLIRNPGLRQQLINLALSLSQPKPSDYVNVDHSEISGLSVLMFAKQTRAGRAMPLYLETMPSIVQGHNKTSPHYQAAKDRYMQWKQTTGLDQYGYTIHCLELLKSRLGFLPRLVFDRGFFNKRILRYLKKAGADSYVRVKDYHQVSVRGGGKKCISDFTVGSHIVGYGCQLRLVVGGRRKGSQERIYILTTDLKSSDEKVLRTYWYRFEIEELFRDMKSILMIKRSRIKQHQHLATVLWFVCLGITILAALTSTPWLRHNNPKKQLSHFRQLFEAFEYALRSNVYITERYG